MLSLPRALPQLSGRWLTAFRIVWWPLFALTLAATFAGLHYDRIRSEQHVQPFSELGLRARGDGTLGKPLGSESLAAGISPGQRIVAINGRPLADDAPRDTLGTQLREAPGPVVGITTRGTDGDVRQHRLRRGPHHLDDAFQSIGIGFAGLVAIERGLGFAANLFAILAALLLFRRRARDPVAALLSLALLGVTGGSGQAFSTMTELGFSHMPTAIRLVGFSALFVGVLTFPGGRFEPRWTLWAALLTALWLLVCLVLEFLPSFTSWTALNLFGVALMVSSVAAMALRYRRVGSGIERQQIRWAALGFTVGGLLGSAAGVIEEVYPSIDDESLYAWLRLLVAIIGPTAWALIALGLLVSLLRYRLYDADAVVSRSAGYAVLTLLLAGTFGASAKLVEWLFESGFGEEAGALPGAIGAGLAVVLITPLNGRIQRWAEGRFRKGLTALKTEIPAAADDLRETASMSELLDDLLARVNDGVHATRSAVVMGGIRVAQRGEDAAEGAYPLAVPLRVGEAGPEVATLLVGPRPDGTLPGKDESGVLHDVGAPIARAIAVVRRREAREAALDARLAAIEARLTSDSEKESA